MTSSGSGAAPARVALIAVHGVGDQGPNETARGVARLLQRANPNTYSSFQEGTIDLDTALARLDRAAAPVERRAEFCLGGGAHTYYFDESATPVGRLIDAFVLAR